MATPYSSVYSIFLSKITDYDYLNLSDAEIDGTLINYLHGATVDFKGCRNSLTFDDASNQFDATLTFEEQEILACIMLVKWLSPKINNTLMLKQVMTDRDFSVSSQANQLAGMQRLRSELYKEAKVLIRQYTWDSPSQVSGLVTTETYQPLTDYGMGGNFEFDSVWAGDIDGEGEI